MQKLLNYQQAFYKAIFTDDVDSLQEAIGDIDHFNERFGIYLNSFMSSLKNVLADDFPISKKVLGEDKFNQAALKFIRCFPPTSGCLFEYGEYLPRFLEQFVPDLPYIKDIAQLEWAKKAAYYQANSEPLDPTVLRAIPPEHYPTLTFGFPEACFWLESAFDLEALWQGAVPSSESSYSLVIRPRFQVEHYWLKADGFCFLKTLYTGKPLGDAYDAASSLNPQFNLSEALGLALTREYFTTVEL